MKDTDNDNIKKIPVSPNTNIQNINDFIEYINSIKTKNVMITGGEPLLYSKSDLFFELLDNIKNKTIEIETNGTLLDDSLQKVFNTYNNLKLNISPKLNLNYYKNKNDYENLIKNLTDIKSNNFIIKFVYGEKIENSILNFINKIQLVDKDKIYLMPYTPDMNLYRHFGDFHKDYIQSCKDTIKACLKYNFIYSPRLQVDVFSGDKNEQL